MRIKCKDCGTVLIDTKKRVENYRVLIDIKMKFRGLDEAEPEEVRYYVMCKNCGRKVKKEDIEKLGVEVNINAW